MSTEHAGLHCVDVPLENFRKIKEREMCPLSSNPVPLISKLLYVLMTRRVMSLCTLKKLCQMSGSCVVFLH